MKNPLLAKKLEGLIINLPNDYAFRILAISNSPGLREFAGAVIHSIDMIKEMSVGKPINAMHIMAFLTSIITKMIQNNWAHSDVLAALDIVPSYLNILISDTLIRQEANLFWGVEFEDMRNQLR